ncbi:xylan glycosyltransferase MUCI21-like [Magnolia sinica]|uniref:xylan glycosyltransferase MUCI21-like n=1 Tax=Magnolia sinica TaxID=86752 RepID=UPI00265909EC|nr:xylan glycosyltransferase MUCI21-like [Magnolia sinica]
MTQPYRMKGLLFPTQSISLSPSSQGKKVNIRPFRFLPLLLLFLYAASSILNLAATHPSNPIVETSKVFDSLKTHISPKEKRLEVHEEKGSKTSIACSSFIDGEVDKRNVVHQNGFLCCDRSNQRTDICYLRGKIQTDSPSSSIIIHNSAKEACEIQKIRPYTRKWETSIMETIDEIALKLMNGSEASHRHCDVIHAVPAVVFSTGGYTGNVYHEFNDGLLPLYITSERFEGEVVFVVVEYHEWWMSKYGGIVRKLTNYQVVDFKKDKRLHCFNEMIVGLKIHGELSITPSSGTGKGIQDFQTLIGEGLLGLTTTKQAQLLPTIHKRPKLVIFTRNKSRVMMNLREIVRTCQRIGFDVHLVNPNRNTQLADIHRLLNSADAMIGVHGAAMTHFLFMRPTSIFIQIVPLGLKWAAEEYYGEPAKKLGLEYMEYTIGTDESSLSRLYGHNDPVLMDPQVVNGKGWAETKRIYLENQNVRLDIKRFRRLLEKAYSHIVKLHLRSHDHSRT